MQHIIWLRKQLWKEQSRDSWHNFVLFIYFTKDHVVCKGSPRNLTHINSLIFTTATQDYRWGNQGPPSSLPHVNLPQTPQLGSSHSGIQNHLPCWLRASTLTSRLHCLCLSISVSKLETRGQERGHSPISTLKGSITKESEPLPLLRGSWLYTSRVLSF